MTLTSMKGGIFWPNPHESPIVEGARDSFGFDVSSGLLDGANDVVGFIFQCPIGGMVVHSVKFLVGTHSGNGDVDVRIETVSATTGAPTGTLVATNTNGAVTTTGTGAFTATLTADATLTAGTMYAVVFKYTSGNRVISARILGNVNHHYGNPGAYVRFGPSGTYAAGNTSPSRVSTPIFVFRDSSNVSYQIPGVDPISVYSETVFASASTPDERGVRLIPRVPMRVVGWYVMGQIAAADCAIVLYDSTPTALLTYNIDKDWGSAYFTSTNYAQWGRGFFASSVDLTAGSTYYLTMKPGASNVMLNEITILDTGDTGTIAAFAAGADYKGATRTDAGSFTVSDTVRPLAFGLVISHFGDDAGSGSGGLLRHPGMGGGMVG